MWNFTDSRPAGREKRVTATQNYTSSLTPSQCGHPCFCAHCVQKFSGRRICWNCAFFPRFASPLRE